MDSYYWAGRHWALPLDVATQVMASRPDLLHAPPPATWTDVVRLSETHAVALSVAGPHAALALFAICAALGDPPGGEDLLPDASAAAAWEILARLHARAPRGSLTLNPIGLLEAMARTDEIAVVPLVYGYVNYTRPRPGLRAVAFDDAPLAYPGGRHGSVLGGTGIAITRRARVSPRLRDHFVWLMSDDAQCGFIPDHAGQPSSRAAWADNRVNAESSGFYRRTSATIGDAMLRPRHAGYIAFQSEASVLIRAGLDSGASVARVLSPLRAAWRHSFPPSGETGDPVRP
jgi:multiple sugar transport system substrate-binding protein